MTGSDEATCATCGDPLSAGARFCESCGAPVVARTCAACNEPLGPRARFCPACGEPTGRVEAPPSTPSSTPIAERRVTSVLFGDLVGFTPLSESRDAEDVRELLSRYFTECRTIVGRYGGTVEKFIGDAVMAVWGVPVAHEDDAERAVRAGLEMVQAIAGMGEDVGATGLAMRVGVVTGEVAVTVGAVAEGMVAGDAVNTAARVQSTAQPGQVWVDDVTRSLTAAAIAYRDEGDHPLKGKAEPAHLWSARAVMAEMGGRQRVDGLEAPLAGRDRDLRLLKELFHATEDTGQPRLLVLDGEPGIGKSRLAWEFEKYIDGLTATVWWHRGRCLSYGDGAAFWAVAEAVRGRLGLIESDTGDVVGERLERWLADCVGEEAERDWLRPRVSVLLGEESAATFPREELFSAWTAFFDRVGCGDPVVLVIDDAQYAEDALLDFLDHLLSTARFGIFVLAIARPELLERRPGLGGRRASVIRLGPLDDAAMSGLVDGLVEGLAADTRAMLVERAEGIPLFAVETVRALIDRDAVLPRDGRYVATADAEASLEALGAPASLQALVAARLDALSPVERRVLADASVLGRTFTRDGLSAIDPDLDGVDDTLASLQRREILAVVQDPRSPERGQFTFIQGVVRQVAYATQSKRDRKARHLAAAEHLGQLAEENEDLAIVVAQHLLDAVAASSPGDDDVTMLTDRARDQLERAANRALALGAPREALRLFRSALERATDAEDRGRLHLAAARAADGAGDYPASVDHAASAAAEFDAAGDPIRSGEAVGVQALNLVDLGRAAEAVALARPHWDSLRGRPEAGWAELALVRAMHYALESIGETEEAFDFAERGILLSEALGSSEDLARCLLWAGAHYFRRGAPTTGLGLVELAAGIARDNDRSAPLSGALTSLGAFLIGRDLKAAIPALRESLDVARRSATAYPLEGARVNLLLALWNAGRLDELRAGLDEARDNWTVPSMAAYVGPLQTRLAQAAGEPLPAMPPAAGAAGDIEVVIRLDQEIAHARADGNVDAAVALAEESLPRLLNVMGIDDDFVTFWPPLVESAIAAGDVAAAERLLAPVETAPGSLITPGVRAHWLRLRGLIAALRGDDAAVVEADLRAAIDELGAYGAVGHRARAEEDLGRWLVEQGRGAEAQDLFDAARTTYEEIGANGWLARLDVAVGSPPRAT